MTPPNLILASASPRRAELLTKMGLQFKTLPANATEVQPEHLSPAETCLVDAYRKARTVAKNHPDALVLGADTLVCLGTRIFGKPATLEDAERMLQELEGREHAVITGVCLIHQRQHKERLFAEASRVVFRSLDLMQIREYLSLVNPLDKAGAYAIQEHGEKIIVTIQGSYSNVVGLPVERLATELQNWDFSW